MPLPIPTTSLASRQPRGLPPTALAATPAVTRTTPRPPHPPMEAHTRVTSPRPLPLPPGHRLRTLTRHTHSQEDVTTRRNRPTRRIQPPLLIHTAARRLPSPPRTLPQVPRQPLQATTSPRMVGNTPCHNNRRRHATHSLAPLGTVPDRHSFQKSFGPVVVAASICRARRYPFFPRCWMVLWSLATPHLIF